mmetsp:Transcript_33044/g.94930  ORF Transcript_33044/g.94930 Transcript_33044/m.94930 type:complete len:95 (-) Transcript_33044:184-468(-)
MSTCQSLEKGVVEEPNMLARTSHSLAHSLNQELVIILRVVKDAVHVSVFTCLECLYDLRYGLILLVEGKLPNVYHVLDHICHNMSNCVRQAISV